VNILWASGDSDYGGYGIHLARAFRKYTDWTYHAVRRRRNYIDYPKDTLAWERAAQAWCDADVVHVMDDFGVQVMLGAPDRPFVIRYAGSFFRRDPARALRKMRRRKAIGLVATLDLLLAAPDELEWAPFIRDIDSLQAMRRPINDGVLRIAHSPTRRKVKSTDAFLAAAQRLGRELPVEVILVERASWADCLRRKASADIYFDQVILGYGNNAVEAWGMGIPVVAGAADRTLEEMDRRFPRPFVTADESTIYEGLRLLADPAERAKWAAIGHAHARQYHDELPVVEHLTGIYQRLA
jgi:hypothetical protein